MPEMIKIFADNGRKHGVDNFDHILFSYHGLPQRQMVKADSCNHCLQSEDCCQTLSVKNQFCYTAQCQATTAALAKELNLEKDQYTTCFQSRLGKEVWVQPYTSDILKVRAEKGDKNCWCFAPPLCLIAWKRLLKFRWNIRRSSKN